MAILLALLSALAYGISDFLGGIFSKTASSWQVAIVGQTSSTATNAVAGLVVGGSPQGSDWVWGALAGLGGGFGVVFLYRGLAGYFTPLVHACQAAGTIDPNIPAEHAAHVLTALGPAFIHQLAFGTGTDAATFAQGLRALLRP